MADLIRSFPWETTPLGCIDGWCAELVTMVNMMLSSAAMTLIYWGPEMLMLYNDAYLPLLADKHPALGKSVPEVWSEFYSQIEQTFTAPLRSGQACNTPPSRYSLFLDGHLVERFYAMAGHPIWVEDLDGRRVGGVYQTTTDHTSTFMEAKRLRESEAEVSRIVDSIEDAVIVTSAEAQVIRINPVAQRLTGWIGQEALGQPLASVFQVVQKAGRDIVGGPAERGSRSGVAEGMAEHTVLLTRQGKTIAIDNSATPMRDEHGSITGLVLVFRDVEERSAAERARSQLANQLQQIMAATHDGVAMLDRKWNFVYLNARGQAILHADAELLGKNAWEAFPSMVYEGSPFQFHYHRAMEQGIAGEFLTEYPDPLNISVKIIARPLEDGILVIFRDVTEERRRERLLAANEVRFRAIFDEAPVGISISSEEGRLLSCNRAYERMTGYSSESLRDYSFLALTHEDDRTENAELFRRLVAGEIPHYVFEKRYLHADGSFVWVRASGTLLRDENGERKFLAIVENIDERRKAEAALIQSEKLAAMGRLASSIAHEINNPLESVTNLLYLIRHSTTLTEVHEYTDVAERELRRMSLITSQTLRFHKASTAPAPVYCYDLIGDSLSMYQGRLVNSRISVEKRKRAEQPVECFGGEVRQVLSNLIGNAIDAMPMGGRLCLRSREGRNWKTGERGLILTVADTGTGMSPATLKKIFEAFFTTKGIGGTGLGLWISSEIVARHRGTLLVRSREREGTSGTVFSLFLPLTIGRSVQGQS